MRSVRGLLALGNSKLGQSIHHFDLPARSTCPGRTSVCERVCYTTKGRFVFKQTQSRLRWCLRQSRRADFSTRMIREIRKKGALVIRIHVSGDFYDAEYAEKWLRVIQACSAARFYFYSRSWRVESIEPVLVRMANEENCRVWYSTDRESGLPDTVPRGVQLAWLQDDEVVEDDVDVIFRIASLRTQRLSLPVICPQETSSGKENINCGNCGHCWQ